MGYQSFVWVSSVGSIEFSARRELSEGEMFVHMDGGRLHRSVLPPHPTMLDVETCVQKVMGLDPNDPRRVEVAALTFKRLKANAEETMRGSGLAMPLRMCALCRDGIVPGDDSLVLNGVFAHVRCNEAVLRLGACAPRSNAAEALALVSCSPSQLFGEMRRRGLGDQWMDMCDALKAERDAALEQLDKMRSEGLYLGLGFRDPMFRLMEKSKHPQGAFSDAQFAERVEELLALEQTMKSNAPLVVPDDGRIPVRRLVEGPPGTCRICGSPPGAKCTPECDDEAVADENVRPHRESGEGISGMPNLERRKDAMDLATLADLLCEDA